MSNICKNLCVNQQEWWKKEGLSSHISVMKEKFVSRAGLELASPSNTSRRDIHYTIGSPHWIFGNFIDVNRSNVAKAFVAQIIYNLNKNDVNSLFVDKLIKSNFAHVLEKKYFRSIRISK